MAMVAIIENSLRSETDESGYIKRPPNAFIVWSHIHRCALCKTYPEAIMTEISVRLGREWSKLSEEQRRPFYEVAHKLQYIHRQKLPDHRYRPQRKDRQCLSSGQEAGQDHGVSFSQAMTPAQSKLQGPSIFPYPAMMAHTVPYDLNPAFCSYNQMGHYSRVQISHQRIFYRYSNASSSTEEVKNYNTHLQTSETAPESLEQPDTVSSQQLSANNKLECKCEDSVDVLN
ncbi:transcription factor sox-3-like [Epinephelus moara]|uniref:transcription factor sox-3-like n=1 Tax=Epinephelus moara TaxID=300413 RepID=UPI00214F3F9C|nr:transcription factor sox-3-like [Epinephelus moara]